MGAPSLPPWRQLTGAIGSTLTDFRGFLARLIEQPQLWGSTVAVTFAAAATPTRVVTGLNADPTAYLVVKRDSDIRVWDAAPPVPSDTRGVLWLQSNAAGRVTLYVY